MLFACARSHSVLVHGTDADIDVDQLELATEAHHHVFDVRRLVRFDEQPNLERAGHTQGRERARERHTTGTTRSQN